MEKELQSKLQHISEQILSASRNELYLHMRHLDLALSALSYQMSADTEFLGTNGVQLLYNPLFLVNRYSRNRIWINHAYLHLVFHCLFRHVFKQDGRESGYWNLACDIAMESIIDELDHKSVRLPQSHNRRECYRTLHESLKVLTAEGVYEALRDRNLSDAQFDTLCREFLVDDHALWPSPKEMPQPQMQSLNDRWQDISEKTQTNLETFSKEAETASNSVLHHLKIEHRERYDYRSFLRKFVVLKEDLQIDDDAFDYGFYTYGMQLYGNTPLIEPQEFKEVSKIEEFVIAIDTSMSCSGELVKSFLEETYSILKESESFFRKVNIHIIQCDEKIQSDRKITCEQDLRQYMDDFTLKGNGGTDFRPVFDYVDKLLAEQAFYRLKGLLYFTDGHGEYPKRCPHYDTAFVFMQDDYRDAQVPPWAMKLIVDRNDLRHAPVHPEKRS